MYWIFFQVIIIKFIHTIVYNFLLVAKITTLEILKILITGLIILVPLLGLDYKIKKGGKNE